MQMIRGLYAVTPEIADTTKLLAKVTAAITGGARLVQYRQKNASRDLRAKQAAALQALCVKHNAALIINDDVALAQHIDAAGVHLGRDDGSARAARDILGGGKIIGVSCYNELTRADAAVADGANYVAFGSMFNSSVKPDAVRADIALITEAKRRYPDNPELAVVAIGGITLQNTQQLIRAGVDAVAVISGLFDAPDDTRYIAARAAHFQQQFENHV
jgi:thiamine-phosphate pyrophosphorylase